MHGSGAVEEASTLALVAPVVPRGHFAIVGGEGRALEHDASTMSPAEGHYSLLANSVPGWSIERHLLQVPGEETSRRSRLFNTDDGGRRFRYQRRC